MCSSSKLLSDSYLGDERSAQRKGGNFFHFMNNLTVNKGLSTKLNGRSEIGRVKVALGPGKGFLDWLRLSSSKVLVKRKQTVDTEELSKHDKVSDCWVHLFGNVYDVTSYLEFHPGGIPELMRAAGRDATALFNETHAWVNYESMLKSCLVGPFVGDVNKLRPCLKSTIGLNLPSPSSNLSTGIVEANNNLYGSKIMKILNGVQISHDDWDNIGNDNLIIGFVPKTIKKGITTSGEELEEKCYSFRVLVRPFSKPSMEYIFEATEIPNNSLFNVDIKENSLSITFPEINFDSNTVFDESKCQVMRRPGVTYHKCTIASISQLTHNVILFDIDLPKNTCFGIPPGHHVSVKIKKGSSAIFRPYTPIRSTVERLESRIQLMIKVYHDGIGSPVFGTLKIGDTLEISDPIGDKNFEDWVQNSQELILLAAGTGITPMIDLLDMRLKMMDNIAYKPSKTYLLMFINSEKDSLLVTDVDGWILPTWISENGSDVVVRNIVSEKEGRISADLLDSVIGSSMVSKRRKAFICGPDGFLIAAKSALESIGIPESDCHIFQG